MRIKLNWGLLGGLGKKFLTAVLAKQAQAEAIGGDGPSKKAIVLSAAKTVAADAVEQYVANHPETAERLGHVNDALVALAKTTAKLEAEARANGLSSAPNAPGAGDVK